MAETEEYTISQVAELLKISKQTVRRRIESGEYPAHKVKDKAGVEVWMIPARVIDEAVMTKEVLTLNRPIPVSELKSALIEAFEIALENKIISLKESLREEIREEFREEIEKLKEQIITKDDLEELKTEIHVLNENLDIQALREALKKKSFWDRFKK